MGNLLTNGLGVISDTVKKSLEAVSPLPTEFMRGLPDSLFVGTAFYSLITQNFPLGILVLAMLEFSILAWVFSGLLSSVSNNQEYPGEGLCVPGIPSPFQISLLGHLYPKSAFPSSPILFVSACFTYIATSIYNFKEELDELSKTEPEWKVRIPLSILFSVIIMFIYVFWRVLHTCDSALSALGSVALGTMFGGFIYLLHVYLFGRDSINFLGVPLLMERGAEGRPLYLGIKQN